MNSKKYEVDGGSVWFPSRFGTSDVISLRYNRRSRTVEIWALVGGGGTQTFRIPLEELLDALGVPKEPA